MVNEINSTLDPGGRDSPQNGPSSGGSSVLDNSRLLVGSRLVSSVLAWAGTVLIVRALTKEEFGQFSFVFALLALVSIVGDLGLGRIAVGGVMDTSPGHDRGKFAANYIMLRTSLGVISCSLAMAYVLLTDQSSMVRWATLVGIGVVMLATPASAYDVAYQAHDRMAMVAIGGIVGTLVQTALVVALVFAGGNVVWFIVPAVFRELAELATKWREAHRLVEFRYDLDIALWWPMLKEAVPLSIGTAVAFVYYKIDQLMLERMVGDEAVATYAVQYKFADLMHIIPWALTTSMLASMVRFWPDDSPGLRRVTRETGQLLLMVGALLITGFVVFAERAVGLLYTDAYVEGANAGRMLMASEGLIFFSMLAFTALVATGRHAIYPVITIAGLIFNVVLNLVVIPEWSYEGAAFTTLLTEVIVGGLLWWQLLRIPGMRPLGFLHAGPILLASVVAGLVGWGSLGIVHWILGCVITAAVFIGILAAIGVDGQRGLRPLIGPALRTTGLDDQ